MDYSNADPGTDSTFRLRISLIGEFVKRSLTSETFCITNDLTHLEVYRRPRPAVLRSPSCGFPDPTSWSQTFTSIDIHKHWHSRYDSIEETCVNQHDDDGSPIRYFTLIDEIFYSHDGNCQQHTHIHRYMYSAPRYADCSSARDVIM